MPAGHAAAHEAEPAGLKKLVGQGAQEPAPVEEEKVPAEQSVHAMVAPVAELYVPTAQEMHVVLEEAPVSVDQVPGGQGERLSAGDKKGQKEPAGHSTGTPEEQ